MDLTSTRCVDAQPLPVCLSSTCHALPLAPGTGPANTTTVQFTFCSWAEWSAPWEASKDQYAARGVGVVVKSGSTGPANSCTAIRQCRDAHLCRCLFTIHRPKAA